MIFLSLHTAAPGATVSVAVKDFPRRAQVSVQLSGRQVASFRTNPRGSGSISFVVPTGLSGPQSVACAAAGYTEVDTLTVVAPAPSPAPAPAPTPSPTPTPGGWTVSSDAMPTFPGEDIATKLQYNNAILLKAGIHPPQHVLVPSGKRIYAEPGALCDGGGSVPSYFWGYGGATGQQNVSLYGVVVFNCADLGDHEGAIRCGWAWTLTDCEVYNSAIGINANNACTLSGCHAHHNRRYGVAGVGSSASPLDDLHIVGGSIHDNNTSRYDPGVDAGGTKFGHSRRLIIDGVDCYANYGMGIWPDGANLDATVRNCHVHDNWWCGVFLETDAGGKVLNNVIENNMQGRGLNESLWNGAELLFNDTHDFEAAFNIIRARTHAIGLINSSRGDGAGDEYGQWGLRNPYIHDNILYLPVGGLVGAVGDLGLPTGARFEHNEYHAPDPAGAHFGWPNQGLSFSSWRSLGFDVTGAMLAA